MDILLRLRPKNEAADFNDIFVKISNENDINLKDFDVAMVNSVVYSYKDEIVDHILKHGLSSLIESELILEHLVVKGESINNIIGVLHLYLDKVGIDNELIIVDPYFFATTRDANYATTVQQVISKYLTTVDTLRIITLPNKVDSTLKTSIENTLKTAKPTLSIIHNTSNNYHDRFWISNNREKGIITGTSLNGLGNKYALIDRLNITDVRSIIGVLTTDGLI
jgi:hypothetical protein